MNKEKKIQIISVLILIFLSILMPVVLAKTFSIIPHDFSEETMPNHYWIEGKQYVIFCKEHLARIGLGYHDLKTNTGENYTGSTESLEQWDALYDRESGWLWSNYRAPIYESQGQYDLPKFLAYLLTEENETGIALGDMPEYRQRDIQIAAWCDPRMNNGVPINRSNLYTAMPSYSAMLELDDQQGNAEAMKKTTTQLKTQLQGLADSYFIRYNVTDDHAPASTIKREFSNFINGDTNEDGMKTVLREKANAEMNKANDKINQTFGNKDFFGNKQKLEQTREKLEEVQNTSPSEEIANEIARYDKILGITDEISDIYDEMKNQIRILRRNNLYITGGTDNTIGLTVNEGVLDQWNEQVRNMEVRDGDTFSEAYKKLVEKCENVEDINIIDMKNIEIKLGNYQTITVNVNSIQTQYKKFISSVQSAESKLINLIAQLDEEMQELEDEARREATEAYDACQPLYRHGKYYEQFYKQYVSADGTEEGQDTNYPTHVKDKTNQEEVKVLIDHATQTYTIGPFSMEYPNYYYERGTTRRNYFDWVEDIYLIDKNGNKKEELQIVTEDSELTGPESSAPMPGEKFWIKFQNESDNGGKLDLQSVKVRIKFKYLRNCLGKYELYTTKEDEELEWKHMSEYDPETGELIDEWMECFKNGKEHRQVTYALEVGKMEFDFNMDDEKDNKQYWTNVTPTSVYDTCELELYANILPLGMEIGGIVFEDAAGSKEMITNGIYVAENGDVLLPGIEVSLYEFENRRIGKLAELATEESTTAGDENTVYEEKNRQNPTLTDENGRYLFKGVDPMKKYVVMFTYNGQTYMPVDYKVRGEKSESVEVEYDSVSENPGVQDIYNWRIDSKSTETINDRNNFDNDFASIGSSPSNYRIRTRALQSSALYDGNYNKTYSEYDLAGITLNADGKYVQTGPQLIDAYIETTSREGTKIVGTKSSDKYRQGLITTKILEYIEREKKYPKDLRNDIYAPIVNQIGGDTAETWRKLQFIEDCKINAYTGDIRNNNDRGLDVYPIYERFVIDTKDYKDLTYYHKDNELLYYGVDEEIDPKLKSRPAVVIKYTGAQETVEDVYKALYNGQYYLNLGLGRRQKFDAALRKDVFKATLQINGKTQVYEYNQREVDMITEAEKQELERLEKQYGRNSEQYLEYKTKVENDSEQGNRFWEIQARMLDYATYYDTVHNYNRELYKADYVYPGYPESTGDGKLEAYVTYKITIRNQSQGILAKIDEVVDYYDNTYEPVWDKSWVMYKDRNANNSEIKVTDQEFYDIMVGDRNVADGQKYRAVTSRTNQFESQYSKTTQFKDSFKTEGYDTIYVDGLKDKKLGTGESAYIYLTFKVKGSGNGLSLAEATTDPGKQNIAEINGYSTFYADQTQLPNGITKNSGDVAGLIDIDSNAGNFTVDHLKNRAGNKKYEQNFEDDADRARGIKVFVQEGDNVLERKISGVAWEDKRDTLVEDALIGNGIRQDGEVKISGVKVELLEVKLDKDGNPAFDSNGDIITKGIAKYYDRDGNSHDATTVTSNNGEYTFVGIVPGDYIVRFTYGGGYTTKYNGQDYKTTTYQTGIEQAGRTDISKDADPGYVGYTNYGTYDDKGNNYAQNASGTYGYDINKADYNSSGNVSDAKDLWRLRAAVNNYSSTNYSGVINDKANTLDTDVAKGNQNTKTQMIADTGVIRFEFEYNRQNSTQNSIDGQARSNNDYHGTQTGVKDYEGANNGAQNQFNGVYHIKNVDLGLEERPKAGLELNKKVSNVKITLANQTVLFDASKSVSNLIWQAKSAYNVNDKKQISTYDNVAQRVTNGAKNVYSDYTRYTDLRNNINQDLIYGKVTKENGLIQATMDEELMHGATITITYDFTVSNMGEVDYKETNFYYTGKVANKDNNIVKTSADLVIDYVANNLQFRADNNDSKWGWNTIENKKITDNGYVNRDVAAELKNYNSIIITGALGKGANAANALIPLESTVNKNKTSHTQLVLSQLITSQNKNDDLSYNNIAEIVQISNDVGRRMAYSVQGNQKPSELPKEADASKAEQVLILPPFGNGGTILYVALGSLVAAILAVGIVVIKKVVLKTKE